MSTTRAERQASDISGPVEGSIWVLALTTSASSEQNFAASGYFNSSTFAPQYVTMKCSVRWYITMKDSATVTDPDETATSTAARTWEVAADEPFHVRVGPGVRQYWKAKGSASGKLRIYPSSSNVAAAD